MATQGEEEQNMLNIIIYEDKPLYMQKNINAINTALANYDIDYRIYKFDIFNDELNTLIKNKDLDKLYILDVETSDKSGIEVASIIREDDFESVIIFATAYDKYHNDIFYNRLMVLDFVCKYNGYEKRLKEDIIAAVKILYDNKTFVFKYNHVVYRVPYSQINFVEKEPLIKRCIIHTINNDLYIVNSIDRLVKLLGSGFLRTHQSCIVNIDNIKEVDFANNVITFKDNTSTVLLTDKMKGRLKEYVEFYK